MSRATAQALLAVLRRLEKATQARDVVAMRQAREEAIAMMGAKA